MAPIYHGNPPTAVAAHLLNASAYNRRRHTAHPGSDHMRDIEHDALKQEPVLLLHACSTPDNISIR